MAKQLDGHVGAQVDKRILPPFVTDKLEIFSTYDPDGPGTVRNTNCWAYDLDLTGVSNGQDNEARPGHNNGCTLITRRHAITAGHLIADPLESGQNGTDIGDSAYFFEADGATRLAEIVAIEHMAPAFPAADTAIIRFANDLPAAIKDYKIVPSNFATYLSVPDDSGSGSADPPPAAVNGWRPLAVCHNNDRQIAVADWQQVYGWNQPPDAIKAYYKSPTDAQRLLYYRSVEIGDSGSPVFLIVNDELVFVHCEEYSGGVGTFPALNIAAINTAIAATDTTAGFDTGYTLTEYDLAAAAASIVNAGYHGLLGWIDGWLSIGQDNIVPTVPGLEVTMPVNRMHYTMPENRMHHTMPENRMHYTIPEED